MAQNYEPIAIVGMGCRVPGANSPTDLWNLLIEGKDMVKDLDNTRWNQEKWSSELKLKGKHWSHRAALVDEIDMFDAPFFNISPKEASQLDPQIRLLLETSWCALEDAGIDLSKSDHKGGVFIGHMSHDYMDLQSISRETITSYSIQGNATTMAANRLSYFLNQHGPSVTYNTACSSSMVALHYAIESIRKKECPWAIVGGCNALIDPRLFVAFTDWGTMSPDGKCFAFDARANGYVRGEGSACLVLKPLSEAQKNQDRIYAVLRHSGINHDGHKRAITTPNMASQLELMQKVYMEIGMDVCSVDYIEAHGTGTAVGDSIETNAIGKAMCPQERQFPLLIGSVKTNLGHLEGAAGIVSVMKTALSLYHHCIPKNLNFSTPNPEIDFQGLKLRVPTMTEMWPKFHTTRRAGVNSFGIGGSNAHAILESVDSCEKMKCEKTDEYFCMCTQFQSPESFQTYCKNIKTIWEENETNNQALNDICYTLYERRSQLSHRYCIVNKPSVITYCLENIDTSEIQRKVIKGLALENQSRKIVMVFCGQGTQWKQMGMELLSVSSTYQQIFDKCHQIMYQKANINLYEALCDYRINTAAISQPATTAIQLSLVELLKTWDIFPDAVVGHSSGEIAACFAAGAVTLEEAMDLAVYRGVMIEEHCRKDGCMAAIGAGVEKVRELIEGYDEVYIATENSPKSVTVSGKRENMEEFLKNVSEDGYFVRMLDINQAYHSPFMNAAMPHYLDRIRDIHGKEFTCQFYSTVHSRLITDHNEICGQYFIDNLTHPVLFSSTIQKIGETHANSLFIEIGPHPTLHRPILQSLEGKVEEDQIFGTLAREQSDVLNIKQTIAHLFCNGNNYPIPMSWMIPCANFFPNLPIYPFNKKRLWTVSEESMRFLHSPVLHPLLGIKEPSIEPLYKSRIDLKENQFFLDHRILGSLLAPAAMYLEMSCAALRDIFKKNKGCIYYAHFEQPLILNEEEICTLFTSYNIKGNELTISNRKMIDYDYNSQSPWIEYYRCHLSADTEEWCIGDPLDVILQRLQGETQDIKGDKIYSALSAEGLEFGETFQTLKSVHRSTREGWCQIELNLSEKPEESYLFHPTLIDSLYQSVISTISGAPCAYIPIGVDSLSFDFNNFKNNSTIISYVQLVSNNKIVEANVYMYCENQLFMWARGAKLQAMQSTSSTTLSNLLFSQQYEEIKLETLDEPLLPTADEPLALLASSNSAMASIILEFLGESAIFIEDLTQVPKNAIGYLALFESIENVIEPIDMHPLLSLTQTLINSENKSPLFIVTVGGNGNITNPSVTSAVGFGRALQNEITRFPTYLFDLDPNESIDVQSDMLSTMISLNFKNETEIIERSQRLFTIKIQQEAAPEGIIPDKEPVDCQWLLDLFKPGLLDTFFRKEFRERELQPHEILWEVHYSGINYKDIMISMGVLKEDAFKGGFSKTNLGLEGSGVVLKVGKEVKKLKVGDRCFGICPQGCGTHSITQDCHLFKIPKHWSAEQASGVFVPYTTAFACSIKCNFKAGDHILIHGGSGGVGSCAIQLARNAGAIVYSTASTDHKREYCKRMGAHYSFNSRDGQFVQEIKKLTRGHGCDVIINCLSNQLMKDSVRLLAPYGRFMEIGKTDAMSDNQLNIHDLLENGNYMFFDLDRHLEQRMDITTQWGTNMVELLEKGKLLPMDTKVYPISSIQDAYRYLAQSKHLGKVVLQLKDPINNNWLPTNIPYQKQFPFSETGVYIVAGGTKGLGLEITQWMASLGGNHFILLNRSGILDAEGNNAIQMMREKYFLKVEIVACDITNENQVNSLIRSIKERKVTIKGILHSAMVLSDHFIATMTKEQFDSSYNTKAMGVFHLHNSIQMFNMEPTEFFIVFSSISSIIGNPGQSNYCAGNCYMEGLMQYRNSIGCKGLVFNLGAVRDAGAIFRNSEIVNSNLKADMISCNSIKKCLLFSLKVPPIGNQVIITNFSKSTIQMLQNRNKFESILTNMESGPTNSESLLITKAMMLPLDQIQNFILTNIKASLSKMIGTNEASIRSDQSLTTLGIDSIAAVELKNYLDNQFDTNIPVFELTSGKTIGGLIDDMTKVTMERKSNTNASTQPIIKKKSQFITVRELQRIQEEPSTKTEADLVQERLESLMKETTPLTIQKPKFYTEYNYNNNDVGSTHFEFSKTREFTEVSAYIKWLKWNPYYFTQCHISPTISKIEGTGNCIDFSSYDYLGMSSHPEVREASKLAVDIYGTSVSASRLTGGQIPLHMELEKEISSFLGVEDAIVYLGGHTANVNTIKTLFTRKDLICYDELSHNSLLEGITYSGAQSIQFEHNNYNDLDHKLLSKRKKHEKVLIIIEGLYSMDGDMPDLPSFIKVKNKHNCVLMVDEAHSIGVLGDTGRGIREQFNVSPQSVEIWMGSLGKSFASAGGYIAGSKELVTILRYRAPGFIYSIGLSPAAAAAALKSIQLTKEHPEYVEILHNRCQYFKTLCMKEGIEIGPCSHVPSAVVSVFVGATEKCLNVLQSLRKEGVLVTPGMWPACPHGKARLRFFINATHSEENLRKTVVAIKKVFLQEKISTLIQDIEKKDVENENRELQNRTGVETNADISKN